MESKGRRTPRMTAPAAPPTSRTVSEPAATPTPQPMPKPAATSTPQLMSEPADPQKTAAPAEQSAHPPTLQPIPGPTDPEKIATPAEEPILPPEFVVERVSSSVSALLPLPLSAAEPSAAVEHDTFEMIAESRTALADAVESISDQLASFTRQRIDATAYTAIQMLRIRTWADAVAVNASFARTSYDQWLDSAAKVSELGIKFALESSKPFVSGLGKVWTSAGHGR